MTAAQIIKFLLLIGIALFSISIAAYLEIIDIRLGPLMFGAGFILMILILFGPLLMRRGA